MLKYITIVSALVCLCRADPPNCKLKCDYGYMRSNKGEETCECINPCKNQTCHDDEECKVVKKACDKKSDSDDSSCPGGVKAVCVKYSSRNKCPSRNCPLKCRSGYVVDDRGCIMCQCKSACLDKNCPLWYKCQESDQVCENGECSSNATCVVECPQNRRCKSCKSGYYMDSRGCQTCDCNDVCERITCNQGDTCVPAETNCIHPPCPKFGKCVPGW